MPKLPHFHGCLVVIAFNGLCPGGTWRVLSVVRAGLGIMTALIKYEWGGGGSNRDIWYQAVVCCQHAKFMYFFSVVHIIFS